MKEITCKEMLKKFEDYYGNGITMLMDNGFGSILIPCFDHLHVYEDGDNIIMQDDNDINIIINRSSIRSTALSDFEGDSEKIDLVCGSGGFSFVLCNC